MNNRNSKKNQERQNKLTNNQKHNTTHNQSTNEKSDNLEQLNLKQNINKKQSQNKHEKTIALITIFVITFLVAILGALMGGKMVEGRTNPPLTPPNWLFPIVWGILYILIALATYITYTSSHNQKKRNHTMIWYAIHLFFNLFWPLFYFRLNLLIISCVILLLMVITAIILTFKYLKTHLAAGWIFTIYTFWLLYALYLNLGTTMLNL